MGKDRYKILFLTGTRADFGKLKPLIQVVSKKYDYEIFATGMHLLSRYGYTLDEIHKSGFKNIFPCINQTINETMDIILANTIKGLSRYVAENRPDLLVVHGDRIEALAGAIVGALNNILVAHIEGGEFSGTIDESIRHTITKMSHTHFVANEEAAKIVRRMGEENVYVIGSPDIDIMLADTLPTIEEVKIRYGIDFEKYAIVIYHPVTTYESAKIKRLANEFVNGLIYEADNHGTNFVVIYPNNDLGSEHILNAYKRLKGKRFKLFPSLRFEYFLTLLKSAQYIIGNSSAGIREAPIYGVPVVNVGTRQQNRNHLTTDFGNGDSAKRFLEVLSSEDFWKIPKQKRFAL